MYLIQAMGWDNGLDCTDLSLCENCMPGKPCYQQKKYFRFRVEEYDHINGKTIEEREANMKAEILKRGPIACTIAVPKALISFQGKECNWKALLNFIELILCERSVPRY